jgi:hypothetical protein
MDLMPGEITINPEAQKICAKFHYGWIDRKEIGPIERDIKLFRDVQAYLSLMGYELRNPPGTDWYVIRMKKEFDSASFDTFHKRVSGIDRRHMALLTIIYAKLVMPKELNHVDQSADLNLTVDELVYTYGSKFGQGKKKPRNVIESLLATLSRYHYIIFEKGKASFSAGPAIYMLHSDMLMDICDYVIQGLTANLQSVERISEQNDEPGNENLPDDGEGDVGGGK